jgi:hypothetical protein
MHIYRVKIITLDTAVVFDYVERARDEAEAILAVATRRLGMSRYRIMKVR